jgi:hypothetical protein
MKKVLALSLVFALFTISATAQDQKTERLRKHRTEQRMQHSRGDRFKKHPGMMKQRHEIMKHRMMKQRIMRQRAVPQKRAGVQRKMQMQQHRKMMLRRHQMSRRVI